MTMTEDFLKPAAMAIPKEGYIERVDGPYGPVFPKTPANYGFSILAKVKPGREEAVPRLRHRDRDGHTRQSRPAGPAQAALPCAGSSSRSGLTSISCTRAIFDTDFEQYTEDAIELFKLSGVNTVFENLEGFPEDWKTNPPAFIRFVREHHVPSFLEYGEYPYVSTDEIKKALRMKAALSTALDQLQ